MNAQKRLEIFRRLRAQNPTPTTELEYGNRFQLLVAVMLSAQATDAGVNKATRALFKRIRSPSQMLALGEQGLKKYIRTIGLFNTKAKNIIAASHRLQEHHQGEVPCDRSVLEGLPGVGRKTANVILNTACGEPTIAVDTHIFRLANRIGLAPGKDVRTVEQRLMRLTPKEFLQDAHHWLILHGRYVCTARRPHCGDCVICDLCEYKSKTAPTATGAAS